MRSLTSPEIAPLYWPTQARSDWIACRSACGIALAVSAGFCTAGRPGTVATCFALAPAGGDVDWACAAAPVATTINVAASTGLMTTFLVVRLRYSYPVSASIFANAGIERPLAIVGLSWNFGFDIRFRTRRKQVANVKSIPLLH